MTTKNITGPFAALSQGHWTRFMDMHSGGSSKEKWEYIYIEATEEEAQIIFYNRFDHNPNRVSCTCCGADYVISSDTSLTKLTAYDRNCAYGEAGYIEEPNRKYGNTNPLLSLEQYMAQPNVHFIRATDIKDEERVGDVPEEGYVWR